jgi:hypothetical protein
MVSTLPRNGTGPRTFPKRPVLLKTIHWPFEGEGYDNPGIAFIYDVVAARDLLDPFGGNLFQQMTDLNTQATAIEQDAALSAEEKRAQIDRLWLAWTRATIARVLVRVEWPFDDPPPDPQHPETFDCWDPQAVCWLAWAGVKEAGGGLLGPFSRPATPPPS